MRRGLLTGARSLVGLQQAQAQQHAAAECSGRAALPAREMMSTVGASTQPPSGEDLASVQPYNPSPVPPTYIVRKTGMDVLQDPWCNKVRARGRLPACILDQTVRLHENPTQSTYYMCVCVWPKRQALYVQHSPPPTAASCGPIPRLAGLCIPRR